MATSDPQCALPGSGGRRCSTLHAALFTVQLGVFLGQEGAEALFSGSAMAPLRLKEFSAGQADRVWPSSDTDEFSVESGGIAEFRLQRKPGEYF